MDRVLDRTTGFHFTIIDNYILDSENLDGMEQIAYIHLKRYANSNGECFPGIETMAKKIGCSANTLRKYLRRLKIKKYINIEPRFEGKDQKSNLYTLLPYPQYIDEQTAEEEQNSEVKEEIKNKGIGDVFKYYQNNINPTYGSMEREKIIHWFEEFNDDADIIIKALKIAVEQNVRKIKYVEKILIDWKDNGIKTVEEVESYTKNRKKHKRGDNGGGSRGNREDKTESKGKWEGYRPPKPKIKGETNDSDLI